MFACSLQIATLNRELRLFGVFRAKLVWEGMGLITATFSAQALTFRLPYELGRTDMQASMHPEPAFRCPHTRMYW